LPTPVVADPTQLFNQAAASLERVAGSSDLDRDDLLDCWLALRAARRSWPPSPRSER
jgi:hypothetical protein